MEVTVTKGNVHIKDSYRFCKGVMELYLDGIRQRYPESDVMQHRSVASLKSEWALHNLLYQMGIQKDRTGSVDLNYPQKPWEKIGYAVLGSVALILIK